MVAVRIACCRELISFALAALIIVSDSRFDWFLLVVVSWGFRWYVRIVYMYFLILNILKILFLVFIFVIDILNRLQLTILCTKLIRIFYRIRDYLLIQAYFICSALNHGIYSCANWCKRIYWPSDWKRTSYRIILFWIKLRVVCCTLLSSVWLFFII